MFLGGFTGLFGRLVSLNSIWIAFFRMTIGGIFFYAYTKSTGKCKSLPRSMCLSSMIAGAILALHIAVFYEAIKLSNVSIGTLTISTISFFVAVIEPFIAKSRFSLLDIFYSFLGIVGLSFIFSFDARYRLGIAVGLFGSFLSAVYSCYNRRIMSSPSADSYTLLNWQFLGASITMTVAVIINRMLTGQWEIQFVWSDVFYLLFAGIVCTAGMYLLQLMVFKEISAFTVMLTYNLEPVYTIIMAVLLFHEDRDFNLSFYGGLCFIIASVLLKTYKVMHTKNADPGLKSV